MDNLEFIAKALKDKAGQYEPDVFTRQIISYINGITLPWNTSIMKGSFHPSGNCFIY